MRPVWILLLSTALFLAGATAAVHGQTIPNAGSREPWTAGDPGLAGTADHVFRPPYGLTGPAVSSANVEPAECHSLHQYVLQDARGCPSRVLSLFYGYDAWRGYPDGAWTNNGLHLGTNSGWRVGRLSDATGVGLQVGGSVGVYDLGGTDYRLNNQDQPTVQGFVTAGFFRRADAGSNWCAGVVQDWMINDNYSVMGEDSILYQWRTMLGYTLSDWNEVGVWGAWRGGGDTRNVSTFGPVTWQPHNQLNAFWHHNWQESGVDTWLWVGVPERNRLDGDGTLGDYIAGAQSSSPLNSRVSLYSMVNYMHQSATLGAAGAKEEAWNFYVGVELHARQLARSRTVRGHKWSPLMRVANNGLFLVDASRTY